LDDEMGEGSSMPSFSELLEKAKQLAGKHPDQANKGVDKAEQVADEKTGGKHESQVKEAGDRAEGYMGTQGQGTQGQEAPGQGTPDQGTGNQ
jgi:antitoxin protein of toxin-antitoxin system